MDTQKWSGQWALATTKVNQIMKIARKCGIQFDKDPYGEKWHRMRKYGYTANQENEDMSKNQIFEWEYERNKSQRSATCNAQTIAFFSALSGKEGIVKVSSRNEPRSVTRIHGLQVVTHFQIL